jgi:hypothetical protein
MRSLSLPAAWHVKKAKKKPTRLGSKLDFIKSEMPSGIIDSQELEILTKLTKTTVQIRNVFVHGVLNSYDQEKIEIGKVNGRTEKHVIENFIIDRNRLDRSAKSLLTLRQQWGSIASSLLKSMPNV